MPGVFRDIELTYKGETFTFSPTIRAMRRIEQVGNVSISRMVAQAATGDGGVPMFEVAAVYALMLQEAGCKGADEDAVFLEMMQGTDGDGISAYLEVIVRAISPPETDPKKADAPAEPQS